MDIYDEMVLLTDIKLTAKEFKVSRMTVWRWIKQGRFTYNKILKTYYFIIKDKKYFDFLEEHKKNKRQAAKKKKIGKAKENNNENN